ncbi:MAG: trimethylamine methyltransferase family protein [Actinomycetota bacterium]
MSGRRRARTERQRPERDTSRHRRLENPYEPLRVLSDDQVAHIHERAIGYLADEGIRVLLGEARELLGAAGCAVVDDQMVRFDPDLVRASIESAPSSFDIVTPNPDRRVRMGGRHLNLSPVGGPPFVSDLERGRRDGTLADQENFLRMTQHFDVMATTLPSVEASDVPVAIRHLRTIHASLTLTDKVPFLFCRGRQRVADNFAMVKIRNGIESDEQFAERPYCGANVNVNSPRQLDIPMSMGIIDFARAGQACVLTPFTLAGAMAPVTLAGALVLQHLEVLAAVTLSQVARPGAPVVYGAFTSNVDMKSGSPAFGTPEAFKGALASGQLARHVGLPWRSSGSSASTSVDAQGAYETMLNTWAAVLAGANWVFHAAGWQEGGLVASYEKFVADIEMCQMIAESLQPVVVDDTTLALDAITEVGPGGHFFGVDHTLERFATAFYEPLLFSRATFEQWTEDGSMGADERATAVWKQALAEYEQPPIDDAVAAALSEFVDRRIAEGGAAPD